MIPMRLEQLNVLYHENPLRLEQLLYHENLYGWNNYYATRRGWVSWWSVRLSKLVQIVDLERCTLFFILAYVFFIDGINSFSIIIV